MEEALENKQSASGLEFKLHPLVLINISDHFTRIKANYGGGSSSTTAVEVLGCLLGSQSGRTVDISNSFEIKYTRNGADVQIDEPFLAKKGGQYKQVFPKLDVVGWYATGSGIVEEYWRIHQRISELNESPVFLLLDPVVDFTHKDLPVTLYESELHVIDGVPSSIFVLANYTVETSDAERIGVDQVAKILGTGKATGSEQMTAHLNSLHSAIQKLVAHAQLLLAGLEKMQTGEAPFQHALVRGVSSLVHSLPALDTAAFNNDYQVEYNDTLLTLYLSSVTRGVYALHELVDKFNVAFEHRAARRRPGPL